MPDILMLYDRSAAEAADLLEFELREAFRKSGTNANVTTSLNEENAKSHLPGNFSLVITPLHVRKGPKAALSPDEEEGLQLLRWMNANRMNKPSILIAPTYTPKLSSAQAELRNCYVVLSGINMVDEIVRQALQMVDQAPTRCVEVEIDLHSRTQWTYRVTGKGFSYDSQIQELSIDEPTIQELAIDSVALNSARNWKEMLRKIGGNLLDALERDKKFGWYVMEGILEAGGENHARVRFQVSRDLYALALEAILCPRTRDQYWMLSAPVYRRLMVNQPTTGGYLFEGGRAMHCLIIDATTSGLVEDPELLLKKTPSVSSECDWLLARLSENKEQLNIGDVRLLRAKAGEPPLALRVKEALESRDWGIVHYGGHSHYDDNSDTGYVFFPGAERSVEKIGLERFSDWLRRVTFTYFSSCDSSAGPFVFGLGNRRVSNIFGFRWEINDGLAFECAREFYSTLFEKRSIETAFLRARQEMHDRHPDDRIWAAPILIKQLNDS